MDRAEELLLQATTDAEQVDALWPREQDLEPQEREIVQAAVSRLLDALRDYTAGGSPSDAEAALARLHLIARGVRAHMALALRLLRALKGTVARVTSGEALEMAPTVFH